MVIETKECKGKWGCGKELPITDFGLDNSNKKDGRQVRCRKCNNERNKSINSNRTLFARRKYPVPYDKCVYAFKKGRDIVYIGSTDKGAWRIYEHYNHPGQKSFCHEENKLSRQLNYTWHILWHGDNYDDAKHQEKMLIQIHQPKFNKIKYKNYAA